MCIRDSHKDSVALFSPLPDQAVLNRVDILEFIHQKLGKTGKQGLAFLIAAFKFFERLKQDIVIINCVVFFKLGLVRCV